MFTVIRSLLFDICFYISTIFICLLGRLWLFVSPSSIVRIAAIWSHVNIWLFSKIVGVKIEIKGLENVPLGPCLLASRHESAFETILFPGLFPGVRFVLKKDLIRLPLFGFYLKKYGHITVDRSKLLLSLKTVVKKAKKSFDEGFKLVIFPEGTRLKPGVFTKLQGGVGMIYEASHVPIVPIVLNSGKCWPRRGLIKRPGKITLEIFPPIAPGKKKDELLEILAKTYKDHYLK